MIFVKPVDELSCSGQVFHAQPCTSVHTNVFPMTELSSKTSLQLSFPAWMSCAVAWCLPCLSQYACQLPDFFIPVSQLKAAFLESLYEVLFQYLTVSGYGYVP